MKYDTGINMNGGTYLRLNYNENLFLSPDYMRDMFKAVVDEMNILEMPDTHCTKLKKRLALEHNVSEDNIYIGNGGDEVIESLFFILRKDFREINLPTICFRMYNMFADKYGFTVNNFDNLPVLVPEIKYGEIKNKTGLYFFDSPCALNGVSVDKILLPILLENKSNLIVWDNVHGDYNREPIVLSDNLITIRHFTHFYGLNSLRIGYCVGPKEIISQLNTYRQPFNVNSIAQLAAIKCLDNKEYFYSVLGEIQDCKLIVTNRLKDRGFSVSNGEANFVLVKHRLFSSQLLNEMLEKQMIATRHFKSDIYLKDYLRITIPRRSDIEKLITTINEVISNY